MKESNFHVNAGQANQTVQTKENTMNAMSAVNELSNLHNNSNNSKTMSSREIAELTGKLHVHIMRDIRGLVEQGAIDRSKLGSISFQDSYGREQTAYKLDFDATMTLLIRYGMTYDAAKESLSKRGFKEKAVMENLPINHNMNLGMNRIMSSREIAELTGKQHKHVLEDIRSLINQGAISEPDFRLAEYTDVQGKSRPEYLLNFDATMTLLTTYKVSRPIVLSILSRLNNDKIVKSNTIKENVMENLPMN